MRGSMSTEKAVNKEHENQEESKGKTTNTGSQRNISPLKPIYSCLCISKKEITEKKIKEKKIPQIAARPKEVLEANKVQCQKYT